LDGTGKMSKSENQYATLYLGDSDEMIKKKIMRAKTDAGPSAPNTPKPDYIVNLFQLMQLVSAPATLAQFESAYIDASIRYGDMKSQLAADMIRFIAPIREKALSLQQDKDHLQRVMRQGAEKARESAARTLQLVKESMGLNYY
jgi:tryptophanyl-tRNA synthetase